MACDIAILKIYRYAQSKGTRCIQNIHRTPFLFFFLIFRRSNTNLCRNWKLFLSSGCSKSCHFSNTDLFGQWKDKDFPSDGCQCARKPYRLWEHRYLEWENFENPSCNPFHTWLLYHQSRVYFSCKCRFSSQIYLFLSTKFIIRISLVFNKFKLDKV